MKEKTRSENAAWSSSSYQTFIDTGLICDNSTSSYNGEYLKRYETIKYGQGFETFNPCEHFKFHVVLDNPGMVPFQATTNRMDHSDSPVAIAEYPPLSTRDWLLSEIGGKPTRIFWQEFARRAVHAMTPTLESGFSVGNFIYEIRELKSLISGWGWKRSKLLDRVSDVSLNYSYGVRPLMYDLKASVIGLLDIRYRLLQFKAGAGKLQARHYSEHAGRVETSRTQSGSSWTVKHDYVVPDVVYSATMHYTYQMPKIDEHLEVMKTLLDTLGVPSNLGGLAAIAWEAFPYSFVIDWFINVGDYLQQLRKTWVETNIYIKQFGVSVKFEYIGSSELLRFNVPYSASDWFPRSGFSGKYYLRIPLKVDDRVFWPSTGGTQGLNLRTFFLGSLLIRQRL